MTYFVMVVPSVVVVLGVVVVVGTVFSMALFSGATGVGVVSDLLQALRVILRAITKAKAKTFFIRKGIKE